MWISLNIISKMVDISNLSPEEIAERLTMSTAEIEEIEYINQHLKTIYTVKALDVKKHPDADKLTIVDADSGDKKYKIVCGAPNHKKGDILALATVGTKLTEDFVIKKSKIRGEESEGMLCSEKEMGFSDDHAGILVLPEDTPLGIPLSELYPDRVDIRLEIDNKSITHRPDLWSHEGFAREIGAIFSLPFKTPVDKTISNSFKGKDIISIENKAPKKCPRYSSLIIKNISVSESPEWLKALVTSIGMRPINNIVDITNYVMVEIGEPMHAFDLKKINGDKIIIRMADKNEKITTLDDQKLDLTEDDILIADINGPIALAGVMGGSNSEIDDTTDTIVLEAANFDPINIRKTAGKFDLRTEAAVRFEKSLSPELTANALTRCYDLIKQVIPEAEAITEIIDSYPIKQEEISVNISTDHIRKKLGQNIPDERIQEILTSLEFKIEKTGSNMTIKVPYYRSTKDISIPADIVEEVGRIYGYDNIHDAAPLVPCMPPKINDFRKFENKLKGILTNNFHMIEVSAYSFVGEDTLDKLKVNKNLELRLKNPLSLEQDRLRRSLIPNLVQMVEFNQRQNQTFSIYELGRTYIKEDRTSPDLAKENFRLTGAIFNRKADEPLFYNAKSIIKGLIEMIKIRSFRLVPETENLPPYAHPGRSMKILINNEDAGLIFELHPGIKNNFDINGSTAIFDIDADKLFNAKKIDTTFNGLQKYPEVPFEISVIADNNIYTDDIVTIIKKAERKFIKKVEIISIYKGDPIPEEKKSISIKILFSSKDRTLESKEIEKFQNNIISRLNKNGFNLR